MTRKILIPALLCIGSLFFSANAQTIVDAVRYSQQDISATGRFMGVGASMSSLGADFSSMFTNPAGMAYFRKSELLFTPGFMGVATESTMEGIAPRTIRESVNNFRLANVGLVLASEPRSGNWKTVNFGIGLMRMANYQKEFLYQGRNGGSIVDRWTAMADGLTPGQLDDFEAGIAWETGAIFGPFDGLYFNDFMDNPDHAVTKKQLVRQGGYSNELGISLAGNYNEKLMIGGTIGIPFYNFNFTSVYEEIDEAGELPVFNSLSFRETLNTSGSGFNMKFGLIYALNEVSRIGLSVQTPTFMRISENFNNELTYSFTENNIMERNTSRSPNGEFQYRFTSPLRVSGGFGTILGGRGFISADAEFVDFRSARFRFNSPNISDAEFELELNEDIRDRLSSTFNFKLGGELAGDNWRLRGGLFLDGSPFFGDNSYNFGYSLGAGIREKSFFIDLAYVLRTRDERFSPYAITGAPSPQVNNQIRLTQLLLTIGFKI